MAANISIALNFKPAERNFSCVICKSVGKISSWIVRYLDHPGGCNIALTLGSIDKQTQNAVTSMVALSDLVPYN